MRIQSPVEYSFEIEKSRFIGYLYRVFSVDEAKAYLEKIRRLHPDATHVVHAYRIGQTTAHSSDDHEPSGTAGVPVLEVLQKNDLTDTICLVVRYFGGIKLGAGGLTRAYTKAAAGAVQRATITQPQTLNEYALTIDYSLLGKLENEIRNHYILVNIEYAVEPTIVFRTDTDPRDIISGLTSGRYQPVFCRKVETEIIIRRPSAH